MSEIYKYYSFEDLKLNLFRIKNIKEYAKLSFL